MFSRKNREINSSKPSPSSIRHYSDEELKNLLDQYEIIDSRLMNGVCAEILRRQLNISKKVAEPEGI